MSDFKHRQKLFDHLFAYRGRKIITLITSTKKPEPLFATQIAQDILPIFYKILKRDKRAENIDLLIHSAGGQIDTPWPLINLIREYYNDINLIVPWRAHSAATLIALGANIIEMGPLASLSPIDPQFNIEVGQKKGVIGASVEDIFGYFSLIKDTLTLDSPGRTEALKILADRISAEILGKISRTRKEIRIISTNLLKLHLKNESIIEKIVSTLVEKLPSHQYLINRREAKDLGLPIKYMDKNHEEISFNILKSYLDEAKMEEPGMFIEFDSEEVTKTIEMSRAFIETKEKSFAFRSQYIIHRDGKIEVKGGQWKEMV